MAGIAVPITPQPDTTSSPGFTKVTEHNREDVITNKLAAVFAKAANAPAVPNQPASTVNPAITTPVTVTPNAVVSDDVDLDSLNFDAAEVVAEVNKPAPLAPGDPRKTPEEIAAIEADLDKFLGDIDKTPEGKARWEKIDALALAHPRGQKMLQGLRLQQELAKPPGEDGSGGIGRMPTVQEIREADNSHRQMIMMRDDAVSDPASFVRNMFTVGDSGQSFLGPPQTVASILNNIPQQLMEQARTSNNPVYGQLMSAYSTPILNNLFDHQYSIAMSLPESTPDQIADKERFIDALRIVEFQVYGSPRDLPQTAANGKTQQVNPELDSLRARIAASDRENTARSQRDAQMLQQTVSKANDIAAATDVAKTFSFLHLDMAYSKTLLEPHVDKVLAIVKAELPYLNPTGWQTYQSQLRKVTLGQLDPAEASQTYSQLFRSGLRSSSTVRARLQELVRDGKKLLDTTQEQRVAAQSRTDPNGSRSAVTSIAQATAPLQKLQGESREDFLTRNIKAKLEAQGLK